MPILQLDRSRSEKKGKQNGDINRKRWIVWLKTKL